MNKQAHPEANNRHSMIEDLSVDNHQAAQVKGGPIEIKELHIKVNINQES